MHLTLPLFPLLKSTFYYNETNGLISDDHTRLLGLCRGLGVLRNAETHQDTQSRYNHVVILLLEKMTHRP